MPAGATGPAASPVTPSAVRRAERKAHSTEHIRTLQGHKLVCKASDQYICVGRLLLQDSIIHWACTSAGAVF